MPTTQTFTTNRWGKVVPIKRKKRVNKSTHVEVDIQELGDTRLNAEEGLEREREKALRAASKFKIDGQDELSDPDRMAGAKLPWTTLISRIRICNPEVQFREGSEGSIAVYFHKRSNEYTDEDALMIEAPEVAQAMNLQVPSDSFFIHHKYVTGFEKQSMPEYSCVLLDSSKLPTREVRGWRSILISLIKSGAITYQSTVEQFGDPIRDPRSDRWFQQLQAYRN